MRTKLIISVVGGILLAAVCAWMLMKRSDSVQGVVSIADIDSIGVKPQGSGSSHKQSGAGQSASGAPRAVRYLPFEARVIRNGGLFVDELQRLLANKEFSEYLVQAGNEAARDSDASALTQSYRRDYEGMLKGMGGLRLEGLSCGLSVCVGNVVATGDTGAVQYQTWLGRTGQASALPSYAFMDGEVETGGGVVEHRFFFSVDKSVAAVTGHW